MANKDAKKEVKDIDRGLTGEPINRKSGLFQKLRKKPVRSSRASGEIPSLA